jgi:hypothetical protein
MKKNDVLFSEKYVNENIRSKAWREYHQLLCVGENEKHPYKILVEKARYDSIGIEEHHSISA